MLYKYNISGFKFILGSDILATISESLFNKLAERIKICDKDDEGHIFIQRNPTLGQLIYELIIHNFNFNWLYINLDRIYDVQSFLNECSYYCIEPNFSCTGMIINTNLMQGILIQCMTLYLQEFMYTTNKYYVCSCEDDVRLCISQPKSKKQYFYNNNVFIKNIFFNVTLMFPDKDIDIVDFFKLLKDIEEYYKINNMHNHNNLDNYYEHKLGKHNVFEIVFRISNEQNMIPNILEL